MLPEHFSFFFCETELVYKYQILIYLALLSTFLDLGVTDRKADHYSVSDRNTSAPITQTMQDFQPSSTEMTHLHHKHTAVLGAKPNSQVSRYYTAPQPTKSFPK